MPIYTLKCQRCQKLEDRLYASWRQFCTEPAVRCLHCGSRMERVISAPAFRVEGYNASNGYSGDKS